MRADRLVSALLVLQARGRVTARELADELEVSVKTARRDLEALSAAGIPVYPQSGRNGGWQLLGGSRTDLSGLTEVEARTFFTVAGPALTATPEAKAALRKLVQALPETFRAGAEAAASSTVLDPNRWGSDAIRLPRFLGILREAVVAGRQVRLDYVDRTRQETTRVVHPLGVVEKGRVWYLVTTTDRGRRTFRVGRVTGVELLDDPVERPADFDLEEEWRKIVTTVEAMRAQVIAVLHVDAAVVGGVRNQFGPSTRVIGPLPDNPDVVEVHVGGPATWPIAHGVAGWGDHVTVVDPPEVREHLAEIGRTLVARYG